ncbi:hypothetical protein HPB50_001682 [Hyalomma asiaticum]|uniref:Uncharacterized protein n=1 Tax=Hyalomma asiaticum TaxID=266040 RepID=A0ACB7SY19_HYAAI|nr:hypothetical protein HPB50_001682 [Hyalomma asiaticum]
MSGRASQNGPEWERPAHLRSARLARDGVLLATTAPVALFAFFPHVKVVTVNITELVCTWSHLVRVKEICALGEEFVPCIKINNRSRLTKPVCLTIELKRGTRSQRSTVFVFSAEHPGYVQQILRASSTRWHASNEDSEPKMDGASAGGASWSDSEHSAALDSLVAAIENFTIEHHGAGQQDTLFDESYLANLSLAQIRCYIAALNESQAYLLDNATRTCLENGTWADRSDYSSCKPLVDVEREGACFLYIVLTYLMGTNFFWMFVEGLYLYILVVKTFSVELVRIHVYAFVGWGLPALVVTIWAITKAYFSANRSDPVLFDGLKAAKALLVLTPLLGVTYVLVIWTPSHKTAKIVFTICRSLCSLRK